MHIRVIKNQEIVINKFKLGIEYKNTKPLNKIQQKKKRKGLSRFATKVVR